MTFWDGFAIGYVKGFAVGCYGVAVLAPVWAMLRFGLMGVLMFAVSYALHACGLKLWRTARTWERTWQ